VRTRRDSKAGFSFIELNDGSSLKNLQIVAPKELPNYESDVLMLGAGCSIGVEGEIVASTGAGQVTELKAESLVVFGIADPESYPLQKKHHTLEKLREWGHLRPRTNTIGAVMRVRSRICKSVHDFFADEGFYYVHTPIITASDCEGAGSMFRVTTKDPESPATSPDTPDFFGKPTFLTVSGQLEAETLACALGKVYTFGPTFRAENSNTTRHLSEFWMIEPEMAFYELKDNMDLAERFLKRIVCDVLQHCADDIAFFAERVEKTLPELLKGIVEKPFQRVTYTDAIAILEASKKDFEFQVGWGIDLQTEHERYLAEEHFKSPVIVSDYPKTIKAFYMRQNDDGKTVRAMDVLVPRVGEIIGGSQREERLEKLEKRMKEMKLPEQEYWWYLDLRRFGTVPHSGFGLGLERLVQFVTGMGNIRDVIPFPRFPGGAEF
jgi:asparaginyl-tRNA synthetase